MSAVVNVIPFLTDPNPVIEAFGVNAASSEIIATSVPSLYHYVIFLEASVESKIVS